MKRLILLLLVFTTYLAYSQRTITGTVRNAEDQSPLPGVSVVVKGTNIGTITDTDGKYTLQVPEGANVLVFSFVGFKTLEVPIDGKTQIDVMLQPESKEIEEVVVVGYGTQKKQDLTGSVSVVDMNNFEKREVSTIAQALQGQVPGVDVVTNSGTPGGEVTVLIRGVGTLNDNKPLYVVDGMMVSDINFLNPEDIENIQILKDASATAIYGSRGANGVVIITTKKGAKKGAQISYNAYTGIQNFWRVPPLCTAEEWAILNNEAKIAAGLPPYPELLDPQNLQTTDWFGAIANPNAGILSHNLSVSGGDAKNTYFVSGGYFKQEGIIQKTDFERLTLRANFSHQPKKWLKIGENFAFVKTKQHRVFEENEWTSILISAMTIDPASPIYDSAGNFAAPQFNNINNPVADIYFTNNEQNVYTALGNVFAEATILEGLTFKSNFSAQYNNGVYDNFVPTYYVSGNQQNTVNNLSKDAWQELTYQWSNILRYVRDFGQHHLEAMLGTEIYSYDVWYYGITVTNLPSEEPQVRYISNANGRNSAQVYGSIYQERQMSGLARLNYNYKEKYLLTVNFRADGSSKFAPGNRWGFFPSFSLGWRLSEEDFIKNLGFISNLKLRAGWGQIGNQGSVPAYTTVTTASPNQNYVWGADQHLVPGVAFLGAANPDIRWETTTTTNLGLDFGLFKQKFTGTIEYFVRRTDGMLLQVPVPGQTGFQEPPWVNAGSMKNTGIELSLNYRNYDHRFKYDFGLVFSSIKNEVLSLGYGNEFIDGALFRSNYYVTRTVVGQPIAQFYGHKTDGLFQNWDEVNAQTAQPYAAPGDVRYVDADGDGVLDMYFLGSPLPKFTYAFNTNLRYMGFDLTLTLQGVYGNKIFNGVAYYLRSSSAYWNLYNDMLNRWTGEGTQNDPRYPRMNATDANNSLISDRFLEDGSYLRVKTFQIGYSLPKSLLDKMNLTKFRIYLNSQNLFTFTKYTGLDPEIGMGTGGILDFGVDKGKYPPARSYSLGLSITF